MIWLIIGVIIGVIVFSFIPKIDLYIEKITKFFMSISIISLFIMTGLVFYEIVARKLFHGGSIAIQELQWHFYDLVFLFSIAYALMHDKHVRVDIFYQKFDPKTKAIIQLVTIIFFVLPLSTIIVYAGISFAYDSFIRGEISPDPGGLCCRWIIKSSLAIAFIVVILQSVAEIKKALYKLKVIK